MISLILLAMMVGVAAGLFFARKKKMKTRLIVGFSIGIVLSIAAIAAIVAGGDKPVGESSLTFA